MNDVADSLRIRDEERRARLVARHHLGRTALDPLEAVRAVAAMHSSDPVTPYLACWARVDGFTTADLDRALYEDRSIVRVHAMRRTLFLVPTDELPIFTAGAARDVAEKERRKLHGWLEPEVGGGDVADWVAGVEDEVVEVLSERGELRTQELTRLVSELSTEITVGSGRWAGRTPVSSRLLFLAAMDGRIVRSRPAGSWRSSQYHWATVEQLATLPDEPDPREARAEITRRYLASYGPVTLTDLRWWTGWTATNARRALEDVGAETVELDAGEEGHLLGDDPAPAPIDRPTVAFLIGLDPTTMGWKQRDWYVGTHAEALFDRNGNAGPTIWMDGRVVGGWAQRPDGEVVWRLLETVDADAVASIEDEAAAITAWLDGETVTPRFRTPLERELST